MPRAHDPGDPMRRSDDRVPVVGGPVGPDVAGPGPRRKAAIGAVIVGGAVVALAWLSGTGEPAPSPRSTTSETTLPIPDVAPAVGEWAGAAVLGAGWEEIDSRPVGGRIGAAAAWTPSGLFVWGGFEPGPTTPVPGHRWRHDGAVYDPARDLWTPVAPLPHGVCPPRGPAIATTADDVVILRLRTHWRPDCTTAAVYDPRDDSWEPLGSEFFRRVTWLKPMAWTGEAFIAPRDALAHDWEEGRTYAIPTLPRGWEDGVRVQNAVWSDGVVFAIGSSGVFAWRPGDPGWAQVGPPAAVDGSAAAASDDLVVVVDYRSGAEFYGAATGVVHAGLPLLLHYCPVMAVPLGDTVAVRMCSGVAVWDTARAMWLPIPLDDVTGWDPFGSAIVGSDDALYTVGDTVRRFPIQRAADGSIEPPATIPVGTVQVQVADGFRLDGTFSSAEGLVDRLAFPRISIPQTQSIGVRLSGGEARCTVSSTLTHVGDPVRSDLVGDAETVGPIAVSRPGRPMLEGTALRTSDGRLGILFTAPDTTALLYRFDDTASESILVMCSGPQETLSDAAAAVASGIWSPWE
jgi:hypothetical protein